jgi:hypothetical protein
MDTRSEHRVLIHVGTPKSGTTYLQDLMWHSRAALLEAGVLYPGDTPADHFRATLDLKGGGFNGHDDPLVAGAWSRLVEAARAHEGTSVISHELLGDLSAGEVERVMADLDFAEVHVVATARDLGRQLPAVWQEDLKNRHYATFEDFLTAVRPGSDSTEWYGPSFWLRQDLPAVLRRWTAALTADRVHVVTLPPRGGDPTTLWSRFASVVGVDPELGSLPEGARNRSLGRLEAEFLRRLNERADYAVEWPLYAGRITHHVAEQVLPERRGTVPITIPADHHAWVRARADEMVDDLAALDYDVVGDLDELRVRDLPEGDAAATFHDGELLDAALDALVAVLKLQPSTWPGAAAAPEHPAAQEPATDEPAAETPDQETPDQEVRPSRALGATGRRTATTVRAVLSRSAGRPRRVLRRLRGPRDTPAADASVPVSPPA